MQYAEMRQVSSKHQKNAKMNVHSKKNELILGSILCIPRMSMKSSSYQEKLLKSGQHRLSNKPERKLISWLALARSA